MFSFKDSKQRRQALLPDKGKYYLQAAILYIEVDQLGEKQAKTQLYIKLIKQINTCYSQNTWWIIFTNKILVFL